MAVSMIWKEENRVTIIMNLPEDDPDPLEMSSEGTNTDRDRETEDTLVADGLCHSETAGIDEFAEMFVKQAIARAVTMCKQQPDESLVTDSLVTDSLVTDSSGRANKKGCRSFFKKLKLLYKNTFHRKKSKKVKLRASSKHDPRISHPELAEEEEDSVKTEMRNLSPPPNSMSSFHQVDEGPRPESQPLTETATDCRKEARSCESTDSCDRVLRAAADIEGKVSPDLADSCSQALLKTSSPTPMAQIIQVLPAEGQGEYDNTEAGKQTTDRTALPPEPSEEHGHAVLYQKENAEAADWRPVINSSIMSTLIRKFFLRLTEEQWREVSEGVYNADVKKQLSEMCTDVLSFISESVINTALQKISATSDPFTLSPLSVQQLMEGFNHNIQSSLEISFSQALRDINGKHIPVRVSPEFTNAIAVEVSCALSVAIQTSLDGGSVPASYQETKDRAAKRTLAGAIDTLKSFLTGRGTVVQKRFRKSTSFDEETAAGVKITKKESVWRRWFCGTVKSASSDLTSVKESSSSPGEESPSTSSSVVPNADLCLTPPELEDYMEVEDITPDTTRHVVSLEKEFLEDPTVAEAGIDGNQFETGASSSLSQSKDYKKKNGFCALFCNVFSKDEQKMNTRTRVLCGCSCGAYY